MLKDVSLIDFKFFGSVGKCEEIGIASEVERDRPISVCGNWFRGVFSSKFKLDFSDILGTLVIGRSGVESREDIVEVDSFSLDKIEPLGIREGRTSWCVNDTRSDLFWVC